MPTAAVMDPPEAGESDQETGQPASADAPESETAAPGGPAGPTNHAASDTAHEGQPKQEQRQEGEQESDHTRFEPATPPFIDYYEVLQISRNADPETIHRVYRIMVSRFHPDNPRTGDPERFQLLRRAYHVLSDGERRAEYDRTFSWVETRTLPIFELKEFVDNIDGEKHRRLGILSLLYHRRRINEQQPGVSVLDLEQRMGIPREHLNFTLWYLKAKQYVRFEDNSDFALTVEGVDYLESHSLQNTIVRELLEAGAKGETCTSNCGNNN